MLGWPGAVLGGLAGYYAGGIVADHLQILEGGNKVKPDDYFPGFVKARLASDGAAGTPKPE